MIRMTTMTMMVVVVAVDMGEDRHHPLLQVR